ncbi:MAG: hypothetical protein CM15mP111_2500 [Hyphomicrobiales bacterium]|nr:MAG: hypothetical protein CM15mP111_2500 [Hyphomicrobiales bacterium]
MSSLILILHLAVAIILVGVILLQRSEGGALGIGVADRWRIIWLPKR